MYVNRTNDGPLKIFGFQVYIRPLGRNRHKMENHVKERFLLVYTATSSQIYYWDMDTKPVKTSKNVHFDEGINYIEIPTPSAIQMRSSLGRTLLEDQEEAPIIMPSTLESQHTPLPIIHDVTARVLHDHYNLVIILGSCPDRDRVYLKDTIHRTSCYKIKGGEINVWGLTLSK